MKTALFEFQDYKLYLRKLCDTHDRETRGFRTSLAKAIQVQMAYISQVLNGHAHLSLEQAEAANHFLGHHQNEAEYFLVLVQLARAGTPGLKKYFTTKLNELTKQQKQIRERIQVRKTLTAEHQATYYSSWVYAAVHMLVTIPAFQTQTAILAKVKISKKKLTTVLQFLTEVELIKKQGDRYTPGVSRLHLSAESPLLAKHQQNWRLRAIEQIEQGNVEDTVHFSGVVTVSEKDAERIKERLRQEIQSCMEIVKPSAEEALYAFNIDFFEPV